MRGFNYVCRTPSQLTVIRKEQYAALINRVSQEYEVELATSSMFDMNESALRRLHM